MTIDQEQSQKGVLAQIFENSDWDDLPWSKGVIIKENVREPLEYNLLTGSSKIKYDFIGIDYFESDLGQPIVSDKLWSIIEGINSEIKKYKAILYYRNKVFSKNYSALNLENAHCCMDFEKSECSKSDLTGEKRVLLVRKLALSKEKLLKIPENEHIFRLAEFTPIIIIDQYGKNLIEEAEITGVRFKPIEVAE